MAFPIWPLILGGGASLLGTFLGHRQQRQAQARIDPLIALRMRSQRRGLAKQAQLDPLFREFLARQLLRSTTAPLIGGVRGRPFRAITTPPERLPLLPKPELFGEEI